MRASYITVAAACIALTGIARAQAPSGAAPAPTRAAPAPAAEPTQAARDAAREAYARGESLFAQSKYEEAEAAFQAAYDAVPNPVVLLSLAECAMRLGKLADAEAALQRYLQERPDAADRAEVEKKIADLRATPSTLALSTEPKGASVKLDGIDTGKLTPVELTVTPGPHKVEVALEGYLPLGEDVDITVGGRHELQISLQPAPVQLDEPAPVAPPPPPPPPAPRDTDPTAALWVTGIVGAAGLVTGTVLGFMVLAERSDFDAAPTDESADRGERLALFADVAFGVGAMALVTGAVLYLTDDSGEPEPASAPAARRARTHDVAVAPIVSPNVAGLSARVRY